MENCIKFVKKTLHNAEAGHDWYHINRVYCLALKIATHYDCDLEIVSYAALLHDIADSKFHNGNEDIGPQMACDFLESQNFAPEKINQVSHIIRCISYKNSFGTVAEKSIELQIVQDADRLDALGAIGIARTFQYGGYTNQLIFNPEIPYQTIENKTDYLKNKTSSIHHFYEKLLLLKNKMNTDYGRILAEKKHQFLLDFLDQFHQEWNSEF